MEHVTLTNKRGLRLAARLYQGADAAIIMSHGFTGNQSELGRFDKAADVFHHAGYTVLTYDYAGCGASDDDRLTIGRHVRDLQAAKEFVRQRASRLALLGLSTGGLVSTRAYDQSLTAMVLWSPVTHPMDIRTAGYFSREQLQQLDTQGYLTKVRETGPRRETIVDRIMFQDRLNVQPSLLTKIHCPVLIIHGDADRQIPLEHSRDALHYLSTKSRLEVVPGADHLFVNHLETYIDSSLSWFKKHMPI